MTGDLKIARLRIRRGDGADDARYDEFDLQYTEGASVLDGLITIRNEQDPSLAVRFSCLNANVCKECTIQVNGKVEYACIAKLEPGVTTLDPLPGKRVIRDLVTDTVPPRERLAAREA
jgi:succinate dehydrogenase/fumarate reductase-like Fe-S protein